jgi:hypothetical protein
MMLAKCSNLFCCARFRFLQGGKLFLLESDPAVGTAKPSHVTYFCLCPRCSSMMTLRLREDGTVGAALLPEAFGSDPDDVVFGLVDRKNGLMLRGSTFPLPEHFGNRVRTRLKGADHAA